MSKHTVKFLRPSGIYSPSDVATISSYQAKKLADRGVAEFHQLHEMPAEVGISTDLNSVHASELLIDSAPVDVAIKGKRGRRPKVAR